jgi:hypothetical protein
MGRYSETAARLKGKRGEVKRAINKAIGEDTLATSLGDAAQRVVEKAAPKVWIDVVNGIARFDLGPRGIIRITHNGEYLEVRSELGHIVLSPVVGNVINLTAKKT